MVLVFALAAVLCLQVFLVSDRLSQRNEAVDQAVSRCQNAAERLKAAGGDVAHAQQAVAEQMGGSITQGLLRIRYDENWIVLPEGQAGTCVFVLEIQGIPTDTDGMCKAQIQAIAENDLSEDDVSLFQIEVAWQEVTGDG